MLTCVPATHVKSRWMKADSTFKFAKSNPVNRTGKHSAASLDGAMPTESLSGETPSTKMVAIDDKISTSLVECEHVKAKIGKALRADGSPRMWKKLPPARGQKGFLS